MRPWWPGQGGSGGPGGRKYLIGPGPRSLQCVRASQARAKRRLLELGAGRLTPAALVRRHFVLVPTAQCIGWCILECVYVPVRRCPEHISGGLIPCSTTARIAPRRHQQDVWVRRSTAAWRGAGAPAR
eukprot:gene17413-biopygen2325